MAILFPDSPTTGQVFTSGGRSWVWTGSTWDAASATNVLQVPIGLDFISSTTFTGQSQIDLLNIFSNKYQHYKIMFTASGSSQFVVNARLRDSGGAISSSNYNNQQVFFRNTTISGSRTTSQTSWTFSVVRNTGGENFSEMIISNPFENATTQFHSKTVDNNEGVSIQEDAGVFALTTSMTGLTIFASSMTGIVRVYGYRKEI